MLVVQDETSSVFSEGPGFVANVRRGDAVISPEEGRGGGPSNPCREAALPGAPWWGAQTGGTAVTTITGTDFDFVRELVRRHCTIVLEAGGAETTVHRDDALDRRLIDMAAYYQPRCGRGRGAACP